MLTKSNFKSIFIFLFSALVLINCGEEDVPSPPAATIQVNVTSGLVGDTEFTFTVSQVDANAVVILPKGVENTGKGGILVSPSQFTSGNAVIKYKYDEPGTFAPVVVTSNYSDNGKEIRRTVSNSLSVTLTSDDKDITSFSFEEIVGRDSDNKFIRIGSDSTKIVGTNITVYVPYNPFTKNGITALKAKFAASGFSAVSVGGTQQVSGETPNNFTTPKVYRVTADDGSTKDYTVTVVPRPVEANNQVSSISAKSTAKSNKDRVMNGFVDNTGKKLVIYDVLGTPTNAFDSLAIAYKLSGKFATASLAQDGVLNLTSSKTITVTAQDISAQAYTVYAVQTPTLAIGFNSLIPAVAGATSDYNINANVITNTAITNLVTTTTITLPSGVTVTAVKADGVAFTSGNSLDFTEPVEFELTVNDSNIGVTYTLVFTAKVTVLP
jgi:hypothetical protein